MRHAFNITDRRSTLKESRGVALIITLLIVVLLSVVVLEFDFATRSELRSAAYFRDSEKAYYLARSALSAAQALLEEDARQDDRQNPIDATTDIWATPLSPYPLGDGTVWGAITDESGKININRILGNAGTQLRDALRRLLEILNVPDPEALVDRVADFIDDDHEPRLKGVEPERNKNKPLDHLSELHLVEGMTDQIIRQISPFVTVYTKDDGINVNTAPVEVLQALAPDKNRSCAELLVRNRPFPDRSKAISACAELVGLKDAPIKVKSDTFSVQGEGKVGDVVRRLHALLKRQPKVSLVFLKIE